MKPDERGDVQTKSINTIRALSVDAIQKANSGHPGAPMGMAAAGYTLWTRILKHNPKNPAWQDRDRFVLSAGHASMLLYSLLYLSGYGLELEDIKNFRQLGSRTPGHPEYGCTPGVETTTGPLGQGFATAVGMAMAERHMAAVFNKPGYEIVDHYTYVLCGDGDLMEGISYEAASLAGHLGLGRLICLYDDNDISIEGSTDITFTEDVGARFAAMHWQVLKVEDGNDVDAIENAVSAAKEETTRPSIIILKTHIAYGSPNKQDTPDAHGAPLGEAEVALTKANLGCPVDEPFYVPKEVFEHFRRIAEKGLQAEEKWNRRMLEYAKTFPELAEKWKSAIDSEVSGDLIDAEELFPAPAQPIATRAASGKALNAAARSLFYLVGGSADLAPSNKTLIEDAGDFQRGTYHGRNIRFGVREHAMAAAASGMALHRGIRPYVGTFLVFADYMRPAIRLACLMKLPVIYIFTHDSIAVGEDGPTHQPVEQIASLRAIPGLTVIRPADAKETAAAWQVALEKTDGPIALVLSRQKLPVLDLDYSTIIEGLKLGAYIVKDSEQTPDILFIATGAELHLATEAQSLLAESGIKARIVSMPSRELFEKAPAEYRKMILPPSVPKRIVIEAGHPMGWERYTGTDGEIIGISVFGASGPGNKLLEHFGFTAERVVHKAKELLGF